ncbi:MAG: ABC transporter substrate-binding protein [Chloroflexi bacterium]|nr:ABC transporter substrate-binding protein [Chloroflexota bacterium]
MHEYLGHLADEYRSGRVGRRTFIRWAATLGLSAPAISAVLASCAPAPAATSPTTTAPAAVPPITAVATPAAQTQPTAQAQPVRGGTIRVTGSPAVEINPHKLTSNGGIITTFPCLNFLARVSADGVPQPELATSWTPSADTKTWTFQLRQGVKFHDGSAFNADAVVATYRRLADKSTGSTAASTLNFLPPDGIEKVDDYTVVFHLSRAQADFPYYTYIYQAGILPANWSGDWATSPIGTGPFKMTGYNAGQGSTYVRNESYWETGLPYLDGIDIKIWQDPSGELTALQSGASDMMALTPYDALDDIRKNPNLQVQSSRSASYDAMHMRVDTAPFDNAKVRQALALALNRQDVLNIVLGQDGGDLANDQPVAPILRDHVDVGMKSQDINQAKQLLAEAGHPNGFEFDLPTHNGAEWLKNWALTLQQAFAPLGVKANLVVETSQVYYTHWTTVTTGVTEWASRSTASEILNSAYRTGVNWNSAHWSNTAFDSALDQLDATVDLNKRKELMLTLEKALSDEVPAIITYARSSPRGLSKRVQGMSQDPNRYLDLRGVYLTA